MIREIIPHSRGKPTIGCLPNRTILSKLGKQLPRGDPQKNGIVKCRGDTRAGEYLPAQIKQRHEKNLGKIQTTEQ